MRSWSACSSPPSLLISTVSPLHCQQQPGPPSHLALLGGMPIAARKEPDKLLCTAIGGVQRTASRGKRTHALRKIPQRVVRCRRMSQLASSYQASGTRARESSWGLTQRLSGRVRGRGRRNLSKCQMHAQQASMVDGRTAFVSGPWRKVSSVSCREQRRSQRTLTVWQLDVDEKCV